MMTTQQNHAPPPGYHGRYLRIDATTGESRAVEIAPDILRNFLGGSGLGAWILLHEGAAAHDPLSPAAPLAFVFSPLVGSPLTTSAKFAVVSLSPLTGRINDSLASSRFAIAGKRTGFDALVIVGQAAEWSVLVLDEDCVRLEPASGLTGLPCRDTERALRSQVGGEFATAVIGPAGERLVRFATISHDGRHAGRGGAGAVLGSKRIKALAVRGERRTEWAFPAELARFAKELSERSFGSATAKYRELGTAANLLAFNRLHALPTRNFQSGSFAEAAALAPETLSVAREKTRSSCAACTIGCEHIYGLSREGTTADQATRGHAAGGVRLEYENLFALGPLCGVSDADAVLRASALCDAFGLDTISTGGTIAFAMECVERGLLAEPWLRFGDSQALLQAITLIANREGVGELLAQGSRRAAEQIGGGSLDFAPQVKGLEIPGYEPRALQTMALGFAVGSRGADHNRSGAYEADFSSAADRRNLQPSASELAIATEDKAALIDSLILCKFLRGIFSDLYAESAEMLRLVTGWELSAGELRQTARRIVAARKLVNIDAGWTPAEDRLPERFLSLPLADDPTARLSAAQLAAAVSAYNQGRHWTADGYIPPAELSALGLSTYSATPPGTLRPR
jgi:aldehyde:ferredoxin oxidoreductase